MVVNTKFNFLFFTSQSVNEKNISILHQNLVVSKYQIKKFNLIMCSNRYCVRIIALNLKNDQPPFLFDLEISNKLNAVLH